MSRPGHKCGLLTPPRSNQLSFRVPLFGTRELFRDSKQLQIPRCARNDNRAENVPTLSTLKG
jgi:hypothetical protein